METCFMVVSVLPLTGLNLGDLNIHGPFSYNLSMTKCIHFVSPIIHVDKCGSGMYHHQEQEATV